MNRIAITGGIGSGKSYIAALLGERGIPIYNADMESKRLTVYDEDIRRELIALLGEDVYQGDVLNKSLLASFLFASPENAAKVNAIIHPRVKEDFLRWADKHENPGVVGIESAILYESGFDDVVDVVVMVYAPESLRVERAMKRDQVSEEQIRLRIAAQMSDEEKCEKADWIVKNDGSVSLEEQLDALLEHLKKGK